MAVRGQLAGCSAVTLGSITPRMIRWPLQSHWYISTNSTSCRAYPVLVGTLTRRDR